MDLKILETSFSGEIITPNDTEYESLSSGTIKKGSPGIIARPKDQSDIAQIINFSKHNNLKISVRSGGHSNAGFSTNDGGLVIDLSYFKQIELIDQENSIVKIGGGATWIEIADTLSDQNLVISSGDTKSVGVGGLTLGGGFGWMLRKFGLTIDSLEAAEVVLANGEVVRASQQENSDLFWALKGGGGNFGVVSSFEFRAHKIDGFFAGSFIFDRASATEVLAGWRDYMRRAPLELTTSLVASPKFGDQPAGLMILTCYAGIDSKAADEAIKPLKELPGFLSHDFATRKYSEILEDAHTDFGDMRGYINSTFIKELSDKNIDVLLSDDSRILMIRGLGGKMSQIDPEESAFGFRDNEVMVVSPSFVLKNASSSELDEVKRKWKPFKEIGRGMYVNFLSDDEEISEIYPPKILKKLKIVKQKFDPENIFNQNYNINN